MHPLKVSLIKDFESELIKQLHMFYWLHLNIKMEPQAIPTRSR